MINQFSARFLNLEFLIRGDLPVVKEGGALESESVESRPRPNQSIRLILPSISALEHNLLKLLEECNASGIQNLLLDQGIYIWMQSRRMCLLSCVKLSACALTCLFVVLSITLVDQSARFLVCR
ncbi:hypothetical protein Peur_057518 [Populus x canadensis]